MAWHGTAGYPGPSQSRSTQRQPVACGERKGSLRSCRCAGNRQGPQRSPFRSTGSWRLGKRKLATGKPEKKRLKTCGLETCRSLLGLVAARVAFSGRRVHPALLQRPGLLGYRHGFWGVVKGGELFVGQVSIQVALGSATTVRKRPRLVARPANIGYCSLFR
jgi:hypothetical protein